ncbi:MAG: endonuclease/exonuclease/phosphatase family protein [Longimonas sp.]|uniref:endonuclease/exonuclease/phosphatase family protein n=1 Tax=Longimonas sp. TaxID=2039626 RepID=UPI003974C4CA
MAVGRTVIGGFVTLASMLVLALFSIGFASAYLPPAWFWWTGLPASLLPFLAGASAVLLLLHALLRYGRWVAVHAVIVVLFISRAGWPTHMQADAEAASSADTLTVMSFNYTPQERSPEHAPVLRNTLGDLASTYTPDLIAMQSIRVFQRRGGVALINELDTLATVGYQAKPDAGFAPRFDTRVPLFSRLQGPVQQEPIVLEAQQDTDRHITRAELSWRGRDIVVYNVHLRSFERGYALELFETGRYRDALRELVAVYRRDVLRRVKEVRELRRRLERETKPTLLIGDLNASPFNWEYRHVRGALRDAPAHLGGNWRFTWHTRMPLARIDHVLTSTHWEALSMHVDATTISDHFPLVVTLRFREDA